MLETVSC